jgi:hypothetical protein
VDCGRTGIEFDERSIHEFPSFVSDVRSRPRKPSRSESSVSNESAGKLAALIAEQVRHLEPPTNAISD